MFQNEFYSITSQQPADNGFVATVQFNAGHYIYKAHFPQNPITPGVMLIEIAKELLAAFYQYPLQLTVAKNIKFLRVLNPMENPEVEYKITTEAGADGSIKANVSVEKGEVVFAKIVSVYKKAE